MGADAFQLETVLDAVLNKLRVLAETGQTFGQPITIGDTIIVPYMSLSFGLAGGGGNVSPELRTKANSIWGGAGGGVRVEPVGFLVIRGDKVELLSVDQNPGQWGKLAEGVLPLLQQWIQSQPGSGSELKQQ